MNPHHRMKPGSMGRERVNAKLAYARAFGSIDPLSWPMLVLKHGRRRRDGHYGPQTKGY